MTNKRRWAELRYARLIAEVKQDTEVSAAVDAADRSSSKAISNASDLPLVGNNTGDLFFVESTNRLYIWNGTGWFNIALINTNPTITQGGANNYVLSAQGVPTVVNLTASDPEGVPITWSHQVTNGNNNIATITNSNNVFTITPSTNTQYQGTITVVFTASDGINTDTSTSTFTLTFEKLWESSRSVTTTVDDFGVGINDYQSVLAISPDGLRLAMTNGTDSIKIYHRIDKNSSWVNVPFSVGSILRRDGPTVGFLHSGLMLVGYPGYRTFGNVQGILHKFKFNESTQSYDLVGTHNQQQNANGTYWGAGIWPSADGQTYLISSSPHGYRGKNSGQIYRYSIDSSGNETMLDFMQASIFQTSQSDHQWGRDFAANDDLSVVVVGDRRNRFQTAGFAEIHTRSGNTWTRNGYIDKVNGFRTSMGSPSTSPAGDYFGISMTSSSSGDKVLISSPGASKEVEVWADNGDGTWSKSATISPPTGETGEWFGISVTWLKDVVAISAYGANNQGIVYLYDNVDWTYITKIENPDGNITDGYFGKFTDGRDDTLIIAANGTTVGTTSLGKTFIYEAGY